MILLDNVVEVFSLVDKDRHGAVGVGRIDGPLIGAALDHPNFVWIAVRPYGHVEESLRRSHVPLCRQQEVDGLALLVDNAVEVFPEALDIDVGLIHAPAAADWALVFRAIFSIGGRKRIAPS